jgi:DNA-binding NarL/FixJ family response regulator
VPTKRPTPAKDGRKAEARKPRRTRVLVVADHRTLAEALATSLRREGDLNVGVALGGSAALGASLGNGPAVVLLDLEMRVTDPLETIRRLKQARAEAAVLAITSLEDDLTLARALEAGVTGFLSPRTRLAEVPRMIRGAVAGQRFVDSEEVVRLFRLLRRRRHQEATERQRANRLTPRQREILQLMADGLTPRAMAERLGMAHPTLRTHVQNILTRLAVHTKHEAVVVAIRQGKISTSR